MNKVSKPLSLPAPEKNTNNLYAGTMIFINLFHQQYTSFRGSYTLWLQTSRLLAFYISFFHTQMLLTEWLLWWHSFAKRCLLTAVHFEVRVSRNLTRLNTNIKDNSTLSFSFSIQKCNTQQDYHNNHNLTHATAHFTVSVSRCLVRFNYMAEIFFSPVFKIK